MLQLQCKLYGRASLLSHLHILIVTWAKVGGAYFSHAMHAKTWLSESCIAKCSVLVVLLRCQRSRCPIYTNRNHVSVPNNALLCCPEQALSVIVRAYAFHMSMSILVQSCMAARSCVPHCQVLFQHAWLVKRQHSWRRAVLSAHLVDEVITNLHLHIYGLSICDRARCQTQLLCDTTCTYFAAIEMCIFVCLISNMMRQAACISHHCCTCPWYYIQCASCLDLWLFLASAPGQGCW